jgi:hypothetical protein
MVYAKVINKWQMFICWKKIVTLHPILRHCGKAFAKAAELRKN